MESQRQYLSKIIVGKSIVKYYTNYLFSGDARLPIPTIPYRRIS